MQEKPRARIASLLLNRPVGEFIAERRTAGISWKQIVRDLAKATSGEVDTTEITLRAWHQDHLARESQGTAA